MRLDVGILARAGLVAGPSWALALFFLWRTPWSWPVRTTITAALVIATGYAVMRLRAAVLAPLLTTASLLQGLREGNFSVRARGSGRDDELGQLLAEVNALADWLQRQRLTEVEASALLTTVMAELDVAVLAFDRHHALQLANPAAARLFGAPVETLLGQSAHALGCTALLDAVPPRLVSMEFPNAAGRWEVRHSSFRQDGLAHHLVVLSDVSLALREEERQAWRRLIRVLSHELNNSLTPITSIANSLGQYLARGSPDETVRQDIQRGLGVIEKRADGLNRFLRGYATLARLPPPTFTDVDVGAVVARVVQLEAYAALEVSGGPACTLRADADQLEQLLINLVRNGVDAVRDRSGRVRVGWSVSQQADTIEIFVQDEGPGIPPGADVFVPFFTTKPGGTGIGLALCRQIADAHGGQVVLENVARPPGCLARVRLLRGER